MNKALARGIEVVFVHNPHPQENLIKTTKGRILFSSRNLSAIMRYLHENQNLVVVKVERGEKSLPKTPKPVIRTTTTSIRIHETQQYAEHHEERRLRSRLINKIASCFGVSDEVAEKLLPFVEAIVPNFYSTAASGGISWNKIDWKEIDSKAGEAIEILSDAGWF